jgi:hypothetical protein
MCHHSWIGIACKRIELLTISFRNLVIMPQMQLGFINSICYPIFSLLVKFLPHLEIVLSKFAL